MAGAVIKRRKWQKFINFYNEIRLSPLLNYSVDLDFSDSEYSKNTFCFTGDFESVAGSTVEKHILWIRNENHTVPVLLKNAKAFILPEYNNTDTIEFPDDETLDKIKWKKVASITEKAKVFVSGHLIKKDGRMIFSSSKEKPLVIIIYNGPDHLLPERVIRAGWPREEYWNAITPYSLIAGAIGLIIIAASFLYRPAYRMTLIVSVIALFIPLYPVIPPGLLFTVISRRLTWKARSLHSSSDLSRLNIKPLPQTIIRRQKITATVLETLGWIILISGIGLNIFFLGIVLTFV